MSNELMLGTAPSYLSSFSASKSLLTEAIGGTFIAPNSISIKGKMFTLIKTSGDDAGTRELDDATLDVVIINANPNNSKVYFENTYSGEDGIKPRCSSIDGKTPDSHIEAPINKSCITCPMNQVGSGKEGRGKACADMKHIAVLPKCDPNTPYLLTLKVTSIISLRNYIGQLAKHNVGAEFVVTQLSFKKKDAKGNIISYPSLDFKPLGYVPQNMVPSIQELQKSEEVLKMIKVLKESSTEEAYEEDEDLPFSTQEVEFGAVKLPQVAKVEVQTAEQKVSKVELEDEEPKTTITVDAPKKKKITEPTLDEVEEARRAIEAAFGGSEEFAI